MPLAAGHAFTGSARMQIIDRKSFDRLFDALKAAGFEVIGPTVRDGAIVYDHLASFSQLPVGWTDQQAPGTYRLIKQNTPAVFGYTAGSHSWKNFLYPSGELLCRFERNGNRFTLLEGKKEEVLRYAFVGVRACELEAILIQDKIFLEGAFVEPVYQSRRKDLFILAVNCTRPGGTCFCASMKSGPKASGAFDLALTEVVQENRHFFIVDVGSKKGEALLAAVPHRPADNEQLEAGAQLIRKASEKMGRVLESTHIKELLYQNMEHPRWDDTADRCLSCANCTLVCPTCFCSTMEDVTDLAGDYAERWRKWDSCFSMDFSYIHGGYIRPSVKARYRQWMTHKLASWMDQFGTSGCVGCGRCITWCPVGIDITEEVQAIGRQARKKKLSANQS